MRLARRIKGVSQRVLVGRHPGRHSKGYASPSACIESCHQQEEPAKKVALLYDAENVHARCARAAMEAARAEGEVVAARVYGPQHLLDSGTWTAVSKREGLERRVCKGCVKGKNSVDMNIVVDAMSLLLTDGVDALIVVSTDSDYAPLARFTRGMGRRFHGVGEAAPASAYPSLCDAWTNVSSWRNAPFDLGERTIEMIVNAAKTSGIEMGLLFDMAECVQDGTCKNGWTNVGQLGSDMRKIRPGFKPELWGFPGLSKMLEAISIFELKPSDSSCYVRLRTV